MDTNRVSQTSIFNKNIVISSNIKILLQSLTFSLIIGLVIYLYINPIDNNYGKLYLHSSVLFFWSLASLPASFTFFVFLNKKKPAYGIFFGILVLVLSYLVAIFSYCAINSPVCSPF
jgi:hypothetical protein